METPNYYAVIPANVRYAKITPNAKLLYGEITALCNKEGFCRATNNYFAELYGVHKDTVSDRITELTKHCFIHIDIDKKKGNYRKVYLSVNSPIPIGENTLTPIGENTPTLNTTSNIIKERVPPKKIKYPDAFETMRSKFPHARHGSKKETYEEFEKNRTEEELLQEVKILKRQIKFDSAIGKFLPAMQRWLINLPKPTTESIERKIEQVGLIVAERRHNGEDTTNGKTFCEDFGEELGRKISKKWYKEKNNMSMQSFK